jgi:hypothetical protein
MILISTEPVKVAQSLDVDQVSVSIGHIRLQGVHLQPLTVARSESRRPVVSAIDVISIPFVPYSVALAVKNHESAPNENNENIFVYWSDISSGRIYRNGLDGERIQIILEEVWMENYWNSSFQVDRVYGLAVIESTSSKHTIYFTDASHGILGRICVPTEGISPEP